VLINALDSRRQTSVHYAAWVGDLLAVKMLVRCGGEEDSVDQYGSSPAMVAAWTGHVDCCEYLATLKSTEKNRKDQNSNTILHGLASSQTDKSMVAITIRLVDQLVRVHSVPVDVVNRAGDSALHLACRKVNLPMVVQLVRLGANPDLLNRAGISPRNEINMSEHRAALLDAIGRARHPAGEGDVRQAQHLVAPPAKPTRLPDSEHVSGRFRSGSALEPGGKVESDGALAPPRPPRSPLQRGEGDRSSSPSNMRANMGVRQPSNDLPPPRGSSDQLSASGRRPSAPTAPRAGGERQRPVPPPKPKGMGRSSHKRSSSDTGNPSPQPTADTVEGSTTIPASHHLPSLPSGDHIPPPLTPAAAAYGRACESDPPALVVQPAETKTLEVPTFNRRKTIRLVARFEDQYEILEELGRGAFAVVYRCEERGTGNAYAVKIIGKKSLKKASLDELGHEVEILKKVKHPGVIMLKDVYETEENLYIVTELASGGELLNRIVDGHCFTERDAVEVIRRICNAVAYLHSLDIVHRDLKPANILLRTKDNDHDIMLADFGLSRCFGSNHIVKTVCGTPDFIAPEILQSDEAGYGPEVDMWAVGMIAHVLLCGHTPFTASSIARLYMQILMFESPDFSDPAWAGVSHGAKDFITGLLKVHPKDRMTAADALQHRWLTGKGPRQPSTGLLPFDRIQALLENSRRAKNPALPVAAEGSRPRLGRGDAGELMQASAQLHASASACDSGDRIARSRVVKILFMGDRNSGRRKLFLCCAKRKPIKRRSDDDVGYARKMGSFTHPDGRQVLYELCDVPSVEERNGAFASIDVRSMLEGASIAVVCFSVLDKDRKSRQGVSFKHIPELHEHSSSIPILLVGTKVNRRVLGMDGIPIMSRSQADGEATAKELQDEGVVGYLEASSETMEGVGQLAKAGVKAVFGMPEEQDFSITEAMSKSRSKDIISKNKKEKVEEMCAIS